MIMKMHYPTKVESIQSCKYYDTVAVFVDIVDSVNKQKFIPCGQARRI